MNSQRRAAILLAAAIVIATAPQVGSAQTTNQISMHLPGPFKMARGGGKSGDYRIWRQSTAPLLVHLLVASDDYVASWDSPMPFTLGVAPQNVKTGKLYLRAKTTAPLGEQQVLIRAVAAQTLVEIGSHPISVRVIDLEYRVIEGAMTADVVPNRYRGTSKIVVTKNSSEEIKATISYLVWPQNATMPVNSGLLIDGLATYRMRVLPQGTTRSFVLSFIVTKDPNASPAITPGNYGVEVVVIAAGVRKTAKLPQVAFQ